MSHQIIHDIPGLVRFVKFDSHPVALPIFYPESLQELGDARGRVRVGTVLLIGLAREFAYKNKKHYQNFTLGQYDAIVQFIQETYGADTVRYLLRAYCDGEHGVVSASALALYLAKVLRVNRKSGERRIQLSGRKIYLDAPYRLVLKLGDRHTTPGPQSLIQYLGQSFSDALQAAA